MSTRDPVDLDAQDPLAHYPRLFHAPRGVIYLDGNSLGPLPRHTPERLREVVTREWGEGLITSWNAAGWMAAPTRIGAKIAPLIGARAHEVLVADSVSVNLAKLIPAALALKPERNVVLTEAGNFPTDVYVIEGALRSSRTSYRLEIAPRTEILDRLTPEVGLLLLTHAHYQSAELYDMAAVTAAAHRMGTLVLWDLSHSTGAVEVDLSNARADFAVGCGYKYLNGGPGAPAFLYVAESHQSAVENPISGWMGHAAPFAFADHYAPAEGVQRFLSGSPAILAHAALEAGVDLYADVDMKTAATKARALGDLFLARVLADAPELERACPPPGALRGGHVALAHPEAESILSQSIAAGVIGDFRPPNMLRYGFSPLTLSYRDVAEAADRLTAVMARRRTQLARSTTL